MWNSIFQLAIAVWRQSACNVTLKQNLTYIIGYVQSVSNMTVFYSLFAFRWWSRNFSSSTKIFARNICFYNNCVSVIQFSSQYILLLLDSFGDRVNCVTVIHFSSEYIQLLLNKFGDTVNCVTVIQFSSQYIPLLLYGFDVTVNCVSVIQFYYHYIILLLDNLVLQSIV